MTDGTGLRFNEGKIRYDLTHPKADEGLARVLTKGAKKYEPHNWENGMLWSKVFASMDRHRKAIARGEDLDIDPNCELCKKGTPYPGDVNDWFCPVHTGELHADNLQANVHFLSAYYRIFPQGDDRRHKYLKPKRIGLDIDDVLAEWVGPFTELVGAAIPSSWTFGFPEYLNQLLEKGFDYKQFMSNLPVKTRPSDIPFEPTCYITTRKDEDVPVQIAEQWIKKNGFPTSRVIQTTDKVAAAKEMKLDIFVDDKYETFVAMNKAGILCYLFDAPHNQRYDVGFKRIKSLKEIPL